MTEESSKVPGQIGAAAQRAGWPSVIAIDQRTLSDPQRLAKTLRHEAVHSTETDWDRFREQVIPTMGWERQAEKRYGTGEPLAYAASNTLWNEDRTPQGNPRPEVYSYLTNTLRSMPAERQAQVLGFMDPAVRAQVQALLQQRR